MLGVLKRRLKPKRATTEKENQNTRRNVHNKSEVIVPVDVARIAPSQSFIHLLKVPVDEMAGESQELRQNYLHVKRVVKEQIHPLFEDKAQLLAYDDKTNPKISTPTPNLKRSQDDPLQNPLLHLPKKSPVDPVLNPPSPLYPHPSPTTPSPGFHPAPNICVEGGRIEFIKSPSEGSNLASMNPSKGSFDKRMKMGTLSRGSLVSHKNVGSVARAHQTHSSDFGDLESSEEKCDVAKEILEARIKELQRLLECEQKAVQREKLAVSRLQRQLQRRDATQRDVERERRLRVDTETRLRETVGESERYRATLAGLQREFSKMEDTVRTMLQYKTRCELLNQEKVFLTAAYESRVHQYQNTITKLGQENESLKQQVRLLETNGSEEIPSAILERLRLLENENAHLSQDADFQRKQYERCLDDIANQVVRALLSQKGLREEIGNLQRRIKELENQNHALANILINKLDNKGSMFALPSTEEKSNEVQNGSKWFPGSFATIEGNLSAGTQEFSATSSSTDKRRLRRLHFSDLGDKNILKSLSSFESLVVVPLQRPRSLNLQLHSSPMALSAISTTSSKRCQHKKSKSNLVTVNKKTGEDEGNESPESGNRDEGYSTMSSDVQGSAETNELSKRELEDLKEASDETDVILDSNGEISSIVVVEDISDPDILFIPLNLSLSINPRHSYPPHKTFFPFQHAMRSFSDSHLCLKLTTSPLSSPLSPSVLFLDILDKSHPLKRSKATSSLPTKGGEEKDADDTQSSAGSWCSGVVEGCWWDTEYVQQWLRLDDSRLKMQQHQRDMLQLQYDRTEIEEWSMSLSCEDMAKSDSEFNYSRKFDASTPGTLPSIQENDSGNLETNDWNDSGVVNLTIDTRTDDGANWSYEDNNSVEKSTWQMTSPVESWSSGSSNNSVDCCRSLNDCCFNDCSEIESKNSLAGSEDIEKSSSVGVVDFTRDFYRLVKFESTKSLASNSSKSNGNCDLCSVNQKQTAFAQDREMALQSVLNFIVEQQKYCYEREEEDNECHTFRRPTSLELKSERQNESNCNTGKKGLREVQNICSNEDISDLKENSLTPESESDLNLPNDSILKNVQEMCSSGSAIESSATNSSSLKSKCKVTKSTGTYKINQKKESSTKLPVRSFKNSPKKEKIQRTENFAKCFDSKKQIKSTKINTKSDAPLCKNTNVSEITCSKEMSDSFVSSVSTPETVVQQPKEISSPDSRITSPARVKETGIPVYCSKRLEDNLKETKIIQPRTNPRVRGTKIPVISTRKAESVNKPKHLDLSPKPSSSKFTNIPVLRRQDSSKKNLKMNTSEKSTLKPVVVNEGSFHEKATTKDVIEELNRMIRKGEEVTPSNGDGELRPLDMACCCPTGWVHVERDIDFTDPKARANLLDVMLASSGSSGGSGSSSDSGGDEPVDYSHLHRLHRFRRQRKASATREQWVGALRYPLSSARPSIIGRENFFVRFGDKEKEAVASFDFLEDISTTSLSGSSSCGSLESNHSTCFKSVVSPIDQELPSPEIDLCTPTTPITPVTPSDDSDERTGGPVSLSDSCADSYSESIGSFEEHS